MKEFNPSGKTVYLDWSHLNVAYNEAQSSVTVTGFAEFVAEVSKNHNLCLSFTHLVELLHGSDQEKVMNRAKWLDSIQPVWIKSGWETENAELKNLLERRARLKKQRYNPITDSFLSIFSHWKPENLANALRDPTVFAFTKEVYGNPKFAPGATQLRNASYEAAVKLKKDREFALRDHTENEVLQVLYEKLRQGLLKEAQEIRRNSRELLERLSEKTLADILIDVHTVLDEMPYTKLNDVVLKHLSFDLKASEIGSKRFRAHRSDFYDRVHLWGAAYCDIFSCDSKTSQYLDEARVQLGKSRQVSEKDFSPRTELVKELWRQLKA